MHYKNGTPAKQGDIIIGYSHDGVPIVGVVVGTQPGSTTCNLVVAPIGSERAWLTASACLLAKEAIPSSGPATPPVVE